MLAHIIDCGDVQLKVSVRALCDNLSGGRRLAENDGFAGRDRVARCISAIAIQLNRHNRCNPSESFDVGIFAKCFSNQYLN